MKTLTVNGREVTIHDDLRISVKCSGQEEYIKIVKYLQKEGFINIEDYKPKSE
jgi:hypothetical protein